MDSKKRYTCTFEGCVAKFLRPSRLLWHTRIHNGEKPFKCTFKGCNKAYTNSSHLKRHVESHKMVQQVFPCPKCPKTFTQHHNLKRHCLKHHNENGKYCTNCNMYFKKDEAFEAHKTLHKQTKQPKLKEIVRLPYIYQCSLCGKGFVSVAKLNAHQNVHRKINYKCSDCDVEFEDRDDYCDHVKTNHKEDYFCEACNHTFLKKNYVHKHICRMKPKKETFSCPYDDCFRIYFHKRNLQTHIKSIHLHERFMCDYCQAEYTAKINLRRHIRNFHICNVQQSTKSDMNKTSKSRKQRKDAGMPKKSAISLLVGVDFPSDIDKEIFLKETRLEQCHNIPQNEF